MKLSPRGKRALLNTAVDMRPTKRAIASGVEIALLRKDVFHSERSMLLCYSKLTIPQQTHVKRNARVFSVLRLHAPEQSTPTYRECHCHSAPHTFPRTTDAQMYRTPPPRNNRHRPLTGSSFTIVNPNGGSGVVRFRVWGTIPSRMARMENAASKDPDRRAGSQVSRGPAT